MKPIRFRLAAVAATALLVTGCVGDYYLVAPTPPPGHTKLGDATGSACGMLMILSTAYNVIPVQLNSRAERAYQEALAQYPDAKALINVTMKQNWYWVVIGTLHCVTLTGEAIK
jgi:hypothetical protein